MSTPARSADRYAARRRPPRVFYAVAAVLGVALLIVVLVVAQRVSSPDVSYGVRSFHTGDHEVRVVFEVNKPASAVATCVVRSRNRAGAEVGREEVTVGPQPAGRRLVVVSHVLRTRDVPTTGEVGGCRLTG